MKVELTKDGLKVNKFWCKSVTVYELENKTFEAHLHDIKGITKRVPILNDLGQRKTLWDGTLLTKITKLKKKITSKTFEYSGIAMKDGLSTTKDRKAKFATNGEKSNYINYYSINLDAEEGKTEK